MSAHIVASAVGRSVPHAARGASSLGMNPVDASKKVQQRGKQPPQAANNNHPKAANENYTAATPRHEDGVITHIAEGTAERLGEGLFSAAFMASLGGFLFRNTIGRFNSNLKTNIGRITYAPAQALDKTSFAQLSEHGLTNLKANYWQAMGEYAENIAKTGNGQQFYKKASALGGPKVAKATWQGFGKFLPYLSHRPIFSTVMAGGLALGAVLGLAKSGRHTVEGYTDLKEVAEDLTGAKISMNKLLNSDDLPPMVKEIRANLKAHLIPDAVGAAGNAVHNAAFGALGGPAAHAVNLVGSLAGLPMAGMMGGMMLTQAADGFKPSLNFIETYLAIKDLQKAGDAVAPAYYAQLMAAASAEVRKAGGAESRQVQRLAEKLSEENIAPSALIHEIEAKEPFQKRAEAVAKEIEAEDKANNKAPAHNKPLTAEAEAEVPQPAQLQQAKHEGKVEQARATQLGASA